MQKFLLRTIQFTAIFLLWLILYFSLNEVFFDLTGFKGGLPTPGGQRTQEIEDKVLYEELLLHRPYWYKVVDDLTLERRWHIRIYIELLKDLGLFVIAFSALLRHVALKRLHKGMLIFLPLATVLLASAIGMFVTYPDFFIARIFVLAGIRWILPLVIAFLLIGNISERYMAVFLRALGVFFFVHFAIQILELFFSQNIYGLGWFGLANRVRGLITLPTSTGFLGCMVAMIAYFNLPRSRLRWFMIIAAPISALLSGSGSVIFVLAASIIILSFSGQYLLIKILLLPTLGIASFFQLGRITGRGNAIYDSLYLRYNEFMGTFDRANFFETKFGVATNTAQILLAYLARIPDSTYVSFLHNLGYIGVFSLGFILVALLYLGYRWRTLEPVIFVVIFVTFGFGLNITESFPSNLIVAIWFGYFIGRHTAFNPKWWLVGGETQAQVGFIDYPNSYSTLKARLESQKTTSLSRLPRKLQRILSVTAFVVTLVGLVYASRQIIYTALDNAKASIAEKLLKNGYKSQAITFLKKGVYCHNPKIEAMALQEMLFPLLAQENRDSEIIDHYALCLKSERFVPNSQIAAIVLKAYRNRNIALDAPTLKPLLAAMVQYDMQEPEFGILDSQITVPIAWSSELGQHLERIMAWQAQTSPTITDSREPAKSESDVVEIANLLKVAPAQISLTNNLAINGNFEHIPVCVFGMTNPTQVRGCGVERWNTRINSSDDPFNTGLFVIGTDPAQAYLGNASMRVDSVVQARNASRVNAQGGAKHRPIPMPPNAIYAISFVYKTSKLNANNVAAQLTDDAKSGLDKMLFLPPSENGWSRVTLVATNRTGKLANISPYLFINDEGTAWFDDFSVYPIAAPAATSTTELVYSVRAGK
jgi:hypothetical protein